MVRSMMVLVVSALGWTTLGGCGSALYDVRDTDVRALTGESARSVEAAQAKLADAEQRVASARGEVEARQEVLAAAEQTTAAADASVGVAESRLDATEQTLEQDIAAAESRRDQDLDEVRRRFAEEVAQIRARHGGSTADVQAGIRAAGTVLSYEQARQRAAEAALERVGADKALYEAEVEAARVELRLITFVEVMRARGLNDEEVRQRQLDHRSDLDEAETEVAELQKARDAARASEQAAAGALAAMERASEPTPAPETDPAEPAADTGPVADLVPEAVD